MIRLPNRTLATETLDHLRSVQDKIDAKGTFAEQVTEAKKKWDGKKGSNAGKTHFGAIQDALTEMCQGARRCAYCEDSLADEIEHVKPKNFYPNVAFSWGNYLYACGPCNGKKSDMFYVFDAAGEPEKLSRESQEPPTGEPVFLDPRTEDPMEFLQIDVLGTFRMMPSFDLSPKDQARAEKTLEILSLESGTAGHLTKARKQAYRNFRSRLRDLVERFEDDPDSPGLQLEVEAFREMDHQSVWREMKRSRHALPDLAPLFARCPPAVDW